MDIRELYEQSDWARTFALDVKRANFSHAYFLYGQDEMMVRCTAKYMAESIICSASSDPDLAKTKIEHGTHPDVLTVSSEGKNKMITVDQIEKVVSDVLLAPMEGGYKVVIIDHFELVNAMAQNKFLKTLEEPPQSVIFLLCSVGVKGVLTTIKSRCQKVNIARCSNEQIKQYLLSQFGQKQGLEDVVLASAGNLSLAIKLYQDEEFERMKEVCLNVVTAMSSSSDVLLYSSQILKYKDRLEEIFSLIEQMLSDQVKYQHGLFDRLMYQTATNVYGACAFTYSDSAVVEIIKRIGEARRKVKANCQPQGVVDWLLLSILEVRYQCK